MIFQINGLKLWKKLLRNQMLIMQKISFISWDQALQKVLEAQDYSGWEINYLHLTNTTVFGQH